MGGRTKYCGLTPEEREHDRQRKDELARRILKAYRQGVRGSALVSRFGISATMALRLAKHAEEIEQQGSGA